jgi:hypothetical protein
MTPEQVAAFFYLTCRVTREDIKWAGVRVFSMAERKMFALIHLNKPDGLAFKVDKDLFLASATAPASVCALPSPERRWVNMYALMMTNCRTADAPISGGQTAKHVLSWACCFNCRESAIAAHRESRLSICCCNGNPLPPLSRPYALSAGTRFVISTANITINSAAPSRCLAVSVKFGGGGRYGLIRDPAAASRQL